MNRDIYVNSSALSKMEKLTRDYKYVENGGVLLGRMNPRWVRVYDVSDAGPKAERRKAHVTFDNEYITNYLMEKEEDEHFFIGTWHSHPSGCALIPSLTDKTTMISLSEQNEKSHFPIFCITKYETERFEFCFYELDEYNNVVRKMHTMIGS
ncbi:Mov34/MPN/PAD-1 family protein [Paenibacillus sp. OK003]|uniref:Mov34/MPN/PAD-1 family protein n=1 Tax=Paenibacillus sp. OK003 TaxID=1884380 RepID=UPI0008D02C5D|nr:Mov34/MPN/PAD-1 family protein [Paenibacillus sp. OK003]SEL79593.1 integrative and conjugative element protein, VC0181 family [Paenibacillus sp. OK003]